MKAAVLTGYDKNERALEIRDIPILEMKDGGSLVSLRGMPNGEFAERTGMPLFKRLLLRFAGRKWV